MFRCKLLLSISIVALLLVSANAQAGIVTPAVVNGSFELPGGPGTQIKGWDAEYSPNPDIPGWSSDITAYDSSVESVKYPACVGDWYGVLLGENTVWGGQKDPSIWQRILYVIQADDEFALAVCARNLWTADPGWFGLPPEAGVPKLQMSLVYFDVGGQRVPIATTTVNMTDTWTTYLLNAGPIPAGSGAIGEKLGIELYNPLLIVPSWIGVDNVRLIPEPATIALLGLGGLALIRRKR